MTPLSIDEQCARDVKKATSTRFAVECDAAGECVAVDRLGLVPMSGRAGSRTAAQTEAQLQHEVYRPLYDGEKEFVRDYAEQLGYNYGCANAMRRTAEQLMHPNMRVYRLVAIAERYNRLLDARGVSPPVP